MQHVHGCMHALVGHCPCMGVASHMNIKAKVVLCRQAARDQEIAGYRIQKDQWIGCAVYAMHRDPKYWQVGMKGLSSMLP